MNDVAYLIEETFGGYDDIGQPLEAETKKMIFVSVQSVGQKEWFEAGRNGLNAQLKLLTHCDNYDGETVCEYKNVRYGIYRTYFDGKNNTIELYLEKKAGA